MASIDLWKTSGHFDFYKVSEGIALCPSHLPLHGHTTTASSHPPTFTPSTSCLSAQKDDMFDQMEVEGDEYQIKPMNCPFHVLVFKDTARSYRDLPVRWAEVRGVATS